MFIRTGGARGPCDSFNKRANGEVKRRVTWVGASKFCELIEVSEFPSPLPSPAGRGRIAAGLNARGCPHSFANGIDCRRSALPTISEPSLSCSLSPRERAGVRGISNSDALKTEMRPLPNCFGFRNCLFETRVGGCGLHRQHQNGRHRSRALQAWSSG